MKIIVKKDKPVFTSGTTYERFQQRATEVYNTVVKPQLEARSKSENSGKQLSAAQKANLNCNSPI